MWSRGWGRREAAALSGAGGSGGRRKKWGLGAGAERGGGVFGGRRGRCVGGGGGIEGRRVKFKAWPGPVQPEGRGAREGLGPGQVVGAQGGRVSSGNRGVERRVGSQ